MFQHFSPDILRHSLWPSLLSPDHSRSGTTRKKGHAKNRSLGGKKAGDPEAFIGTPDKIKWSPMAPGMEIGPVYGNCDKPGAPCVFQLRFAADGKIPPHWHPVDENVTVLSGDFRRAWAIL